MSGENPPGTLPLENPDLRCLMHPQVEDPFCITCAHNRIQRQVNREQADQAQTLINLAIRTHSASNPPGQSLEEEILRAIQQPQPQAEPAIGGSGAPRNDPALMGFPDPNILLAQNYPHELPMPAPGPAGPPGPANPGPGNPGFDVFKFIAGGGLSAPQPLPPQSAAASGGFAPAQCPHQLPQQLQQPGMFPPNNQQNQNNGLGGGGGGVVAQEEVDDEHERSGRVNKRCVRCRQMRRGCDGQRPCQVCVAAGLRPEECLSERRKVRKHPAAAAPQK